MRVRLSYEGCRCMTGEVLVVCWPNPTPVELTREQRMPTLALGR
jgi:hypothetical protein